jgi:hypothetical protein
MRVLTNKAEATKKVYQQGRVGSDDTLLLDSDVCIQLFLLGAMEQY